MKSKWLILFLVLGLVMVACGGSDTAEEVVEVSADATEETTTEDKKEDPASDSKEENK